MNRTKYWNEKYLSYWKERVQETNIKGSISRVIKDDTKTEDELIYKNIFDLYKFKEGNVLDVGCAWGRMFDIFFSYNLNVYGVDISKNMIDECLKLWKKFNYKNNFLISEAESLPFADNYFDNLTCLATFDATYQEKALNEFFRVVKPHGKLYITGKNLNYHSDDTLAIKAEVMARKKGHPNFFTNVNDMIKQILSQDNMMIQSYFFEKRGDFSLFKFKNNMPQRFYEYFLIIKKGYKETKFKKFSYKFSNTFKNNKNLK
jgi:ubiquinone/menaquinone biosynthesis C-methylase UbiE